MDAISFNIKDGYLGAMLAPVSAEDADLYS